MLTSHLSTWKCVCLQLELQLARGTWPPCRRRCGHGVTELSHPGMAGTTCLSWCLWELPWPLVWMFLQRPAKSLRQAAGWQGLWGSACGGSLPGLTLGRSLLDSSWPPQTSCSPRKSSHSLWSPEAAPPGGLGATPSSWKGLSLGGGACPGSSTCRSGHEALCALPAWLST